MQDSATFLIYKISSRGRHTPSKEQTHIPLPEEPISLSLRERLGEGEKLRFNNKQQPKR